MKLLLVSNKNWRERKDRTELGWLIEDHIQIKFTQGNNRHTKKDAQKKYITITVPVGKIKAKNINDQASRSHQQCIGYYAIHQSIPKWIAIIHDQHNVQHSPNNPPA